MLKIHNYLRPPPAAEGWPVSNMNISEDGFNGPSLTTCTRQTCIQNIDSHKSGLQGIHWCSTDTEIAWYSCAAISSLAASSTSPVISEANSVWDMARWLMWHCITGTVPHFISLTNPECNVVPTVAITSCLQLCAKTEALSASFCNFLRINHLSSIQLELGTSWNIHGDERQCIPLTLTHPHCTKDRSLSINISTCISNYLLMIKIDQA